MFQKSLLKNFIKSFTPSEYNDVIKLESLVEGSVVQIDQMVYALYGLSDDEVALVEGRE